MPRRFKLNKNNQITRCPKCDNNTEFVAYSQQCAEDLCEVWVVCKCGFDPTMNNDLYRYEDVWGGTEGNCRAALDCWNDAIEYNKPLELTEEGRAVSGRSK